MTQQKLILGNEIENAKLDAIKDIKEVSWNLRITLNIIEDKLAKIDKIHEQLKDTNDRLMMIENSLRSKHFLEEKIYQPRYEETLQSYGFKIQ
jgi:hypothetical protein